MIRLSVWLALAATTTVCWGQSYPTKAVRLVVPYPAGGGGDVVGRMVTQKLGEIFGQPFVVENRPGLGGIPGAEFAAKSAGDGYTLLFIAGAHALAPSLYQKLPYDLLRDFVPLSAMTKSAYFLVVHPSLPVRTTKELIALAKAQRGKLNYGDTGVGAPQYLAGEMFRVMADIDMTHISYKGDTPLITALMSGEIPVSFATAAAALPHINSARLRALAITSLQRSSLLPDLPTVAESTGFKTYDVSTWYGLVTRTGTPRDTTEKLAAAIAKIIAMPDIRERLLQLALEPASSAPDEFAAFIKAEIQKYASLTKLAGIKPE